MASVEFINPALDRRWDGFVESHEYGWICHLSGWQSVLESSFRHMKGFYPVLLSGSEIKSALPVYQVKSWLTGKRLVSIPFASLCDPLVSDEKDLKELFDSVVALGGQLGAARIEIRAFQSTPLIEKQDINCSRHYKNHFLKLEKPETLQKKFHRTCVRQKISRALKSNFAVVKAQKEKDIDQFYRLYCMTRQKLGLPSQPCLFFKNIWNTFSPSGKVEVLFAMKDDKFASALLLFRYKNRVSAEYLGWDNDFSELSPNHFLFWESIKSAYADGFEIFDFGRTSPLSGSLMEFKNRWGTQIAELPQLHYPLNSTNAQNYASTRKYMIMNKLFRKSPDFIYPLLGNFCYKHLG